MWGTIWMKRIFLKVSRELLPQIKDKYPFIYLEHGRLEVDDSSVKWISSENIVVHLPVATINSILLGPGTSVTHEAVKVIASCNCLLSWVGADSLLYYASGVSPTANTYNLKKQITLATNSRKKLEVARRMYKYRFPDVDLSNKSLAEMMGLEGIRVRTMYTTYSKIYDVHWERRNYIPGNIGYSDTTNKILTCCNAALYGILLSVVHAMGFSPKIGFIHSGCPLPFIYDLADLYKEETSIEPAFRLTRELNYTYNKDYVAESFAKIVVENSILERAVKDIYTIMEV